MSVGQYEGRSEWMRMGDWQSEEGVTDSDLKWVTEGDQDFFNPQQSDLEKRMPPTVSFPFGVGARGPGLSHRNFFSVLRVSMKQAR